MTEDKVVDETKISIERDLGVDLGKNLTTKDANLLRSDNQTVKIKGLDRPSLEVAPKIAQSYNPPMGMPVPPNGVMVPNPEIIIKSNGTPNPTIITPTMPMVPVLPRAVAPPVGDMSISNTDMSYDPINLGSAGNTIIPRLVLRKAPADEVLKVLARYANVNLVYIDSTGAEEGTQPKEGTDSSQMKASISLDIENEPVQSVFNSVLMASGLKASRRGNTIFVGARLPDEARQIISRTMRLNQARAENASSFLALQGAQVNVYLEGSFERTIDKDGNITSTRFRPEIFPLAITQAADAVKKSKGVIPLDGLIVASDARLNSVTVTGEPRLVEVAMTLLTQLDARRRQVAVNVKVVDINLNNIQDFNSSFSFGIGDGYFVQDNGAAVMRFGSTAPVSGSTINSATGRISNPPAIANPFSNANTFLDFNQSTTVPGYGRGDRQVFIDANGTGSFVIENPTDATFFGRTAGVSNNPFQTGITELTRGTPNINTITRSLVNVLDPDGNIIGQRTVFTSNSTPGIQATATSALPSFFQYPKKFQAQVEAQIRSGNAKILTDPTLVVQEGEIADVKLTQSVVTSVNSQVDPLSGVRTTTPVLSDVGLSLNVNLDRIDDNGFITLSVNPTIAAPGATQQFESGPGANNTLTLINKREVKSGKIRLRDGQTLILTGVIQQTDQTTTSKVPILGDIPILGALFRSQSDTTARTEVVIMVTPQILNDGTEAKFGFNYTPSKASSDFLRQQGFPVQVQP
jgi:type IV pilus assembly protein PilQ